MDEQKPVKPSSVLDQWRKRKAQSTAIKAIGPRPTGVAPKPSSGQERLWLLQQLDPQNPFYQYGHLYQFSGPIDLDKLKQSFERLIDQHEILRTNFKETDNGLELVIHPKVDFNFPVHSVKNNDPKLDALIQEETRRPFDLAEDRLFRVLILSFSPTAHWLVLSMHHIIGDRLTLIILNEALFKNYQNLLTGIAPLPTSNTLQYADFTHWQQQQTSKESDLVFWKNRLAGDLPLLALPADSPRPKKRTYEGQSLAKKLTPKLSEQLQQVAKDQETTTFVVLLTAFKILLYRYTKQTDILVGSPFSNRDRTELEKLMGFFNETLVLRTPMVSTESFTEMLAHVKSTTLEALAHKNVPFDKVVKALQPQRFPGINPIFQTMFLFNKQAPVLRPSNGLSVTEKSLDLGVSKFDLTCFVNELSEQLEIVFEFALEIFRPATMVRMLDHFEVLLHGLIANQEQPIAQLPLLSEGEFKLVTETWNETAIEFTTYPSIHELIAETAAKNPDEIALIDEHQSITYHELINQAEQLASRLIQAGLVPNTAVGLLGGRQVEAMIGMLAILKAGGIYLPLDPAYPADRIKYILADAKVDFVLAEENTLLSKLDFGGNILPLSVSKKTTKVSDFLLPKISPQQVAYIIYTSGSSGRPKGVQITHQNLLHSTQARFDFFPTSPNCFLLLSSFSFDSSIAGIFWTLTTGGSLLIPKKRIEQDVFELGQLIFAHQVTDTLLLPSLYETILGEIPIDQLASLRQVMVAGEACSGSLVKKHFEQLPSAQLFNEYGPTEATVWCIAHRMTSVEQGRVPIGRPIANMQVYILDQHLQPVPIGVSGELFVGGPGLSGGYLNRPELTAEKFIPNPFSSQDKSRLYRTGDLAKYDPDGQIQFMGRVDQQVKIRGFRVEPEEIEAVIRQHPMVGEALIKVIGERPDSNVAQSLVAYLTPFIDQDLPEIKRFISEQLPEYMVPAHLISVAAFPLLPNGKVDRKALPEPTQSITSLSAEMIPASNKMEQALIDIWQSVLKVSEIGVTDNFFSIGGDSILSIQLIARARAAGIALKPAQLFEYQTIRKLAAQLNSEKVRKTNTEFSNFSSALNLSEGPLSELQHAFLFNQASSQPDQGVLHLVFNLEGEIDFAIFQKAWDLTAQRHDVLRTVVVTDGSSASYQKVKNTVNLEWDFLDWRDYDETTQGEKLADLDQTAKVQKLDLNQLPIGRYVLIETGPQRYIFSWICHHIFLDGWSCGILLKDALAFYQQIQSGESIKISPIPNFLNYLNWQSQKPVDQAQQFWQTKLGDFNYPLLFDKNNIVRQPTYADRIFNISESQSQAIRAWCKQEYISLSTFFQGIWSLTLAAIFGTTDVVYGQTVSGRFSDFPQIEEMTGLFMNVLPVRFSVEKKQTKGDWLRALQKEQSRFSHFEDTSLGQILEWINWPSHLDLFSTLFVFGNFLKDGLRVGGVAVTDFKGGFSAAYPLTIRVNPVEAITIDWRYQTEILGPEATQNLENIFSQFLKAMLTTTGDTILGDLESQIPSVNDSPTLIDIKQLPQTRVDKDQVNNYVPPRTETEKSITKIWESVFNQSPISIHDNFFEIGGRSLLAIKLFARIEKEMDLVVPPATLLQFPTIAGIAASLNNHSQNSLVPLRTAGHKKPLFCIHSGGGHVFFYQALAKYLSDDQPVYTLQPTGLDGQTARHQSIVEMAAAYIEEIKKVQPKGPYQILGTCFSNAVGLEMANQLSQHEGELPQLFIIDSGPVHLTGNQNDGKQQTISRFLDLLKRGDFSRIKRKLKSRFGAKSAKDIDTIEESESEKNLRLTIEALNKIYADYHWKPFSGKIQLIRSSEFANRKDKVFHLYQWQKLAKQGVEVSVVAGHHISLFEEPEVKGLAVRIGELLTEKI